MEVIKGIGHLQGQRLGIPPADQTPPLICSRDLQSVFGEEMPPFGSGESPSGLLRSMRLFNFVVSVVVVVTNSFCIMPTVNFTCACVFGTQ